MSLYVSYIFYQIFRLTTINLRQYKMINLNFLYSKYILYFLINKHIENYLLLLIWQRLYIFASYIDTLKYIYILYDIDSSGPILHVL
jgi:hypothetical protein